MKLICHLQVKQASTVDELEEALDCCDSWRFQIEGLPNPVTMDTKHAFVRNATLYHVILQRQSCLNQLIDGLSYYGVSESSVLLVYSKVDVCAVTASSTTKTTITMVPFPPLKGTSTSEGKP